MLLDLKRSEWLPAYDEDGFRQVISVNLEQLSHLYLYIASMTGDGRAVRQDLRDDGFCRPN